MSLRATLWAYDDAPVENGTEVLCLIALADEATDDGRNAFPSVRKVAARARVKKRAAQYALRKLEDAGVIRQGDPSVAARHIARLDRRPTVYDLNLSMTWESVGKVRPGTEDQADGDGVQDLRPADGVQEMRLVDVDGVQSHDERGAISRPSGVHGVAPDPSIDPGTTDPTKASRPASGGTASKRDLNEGRQDVDRLCAHLSERLTELGVKHDADSKRWRDAARLMIDTDNREAEKIHKAIDWATRDSFWHRNVHSMPTLRDQYDKIRLDAKAKADAATNGGNVRQIPNRITGTDEDKARITAAWGRTNG